MQKNILAIVAIAAALVGGGIAGEQIITSGTTTTREYQIAQDINKYRVAHHLHKLKISFSLSNRARAHSRDMIKRGYFKHSKNLPTAEVIAWGTGGFSTPSGIVSLWRSSPPHKKVLLTPSLRYVGVGIAKGYFFGQHNATIVTADFGGAKWSMRRKLLPPVQSQLH